MIKHGPVHKFSGKNSKQKHHSHLAPIMSFVTKGVADAKEKIVLMPQACDVKGAKRYNSQQCVIARALTRKHKPEAVAIGRSLAFAVFNGLAIRFAVPIASRQLLEEFDSNGRVRRVAIELSPPCQSQQIGRNPPKYEKKTRPSVRQRVRKMGVRAVGGGLAL